MCVTLSGLAWIVLVGFRDSSLNPSTTVKVSKTECLSVMCLLVCLMHRLAVLTFDTFMGQYQEPCNLDLINAYAGRWPAAGRRCVLCPLQPFKRGHGLPVIWCHHQQLRSLRPAPHASAHLSLCMIFLPGLLPACYSTEATSKFVF